MDGWVVTSENIVAALVGEDQADTPVVITVAREDGREVPPHPRSIRALGGGALDEARAEAVRGRLGSARPGGGPRPPPPARVLGSMRVDRAGAALAPCGSARGPVQTWAQGDPSTARPRQ